MKINCAAVLALASGGRLSQGIGSESKGPEIRRASCGILLGVSPLRRRGLCDTAHVVAFGEPTHGAHEPLEARNRLFRFLVERMGFTAIALCPM